MGDRSSSGDGLFTWTDERIVEYIGQNTPDAEIAVRVGLTVGDVKARIETLLQRRGLNDRRELAAGAPAARAPKPTVATPPQYDAAVTPSALGRRHSRRAVVAAGAVAGGTLVTAGLAALALRPSGSPRQISPAETATPIPTSPTTEPTGALPIRPAPGIFVRTDYRPGERIDATQGVFFMDTTTGAVEGWSLSGSTLAEEGGGAVAILPTISDDNRFVAARGGKSWWLLDRSTGEAVVWNPADVALAGFGRRHLLFERGLGGDPNPEFRGEYTVLDDRLQPVSTFKTEHAGRGHPPVLFSPDERTLAIAAGSKSWSDYTRIHLVDVETGAARLLCDLPPAPEGYLAGPPNFTILTGGQEFGFHLTYAPEWDNEKGAVRDLPGKTLVRRYAWDGTQRAEFWLRAASPFFSPDGKLFAYDEAQRLVRGEADGPSDYWPNVVVADGMTGAPKLRVHSASLWYGDGLGFLRWLADSSGLVVAIRPADTASDPAIPWWRRSGFATVAASGGAVQRMKVVEDNLAGPVPAPDRPDLFALGHQAVFDARSGRTVSANVSEEWPADIAPWGSTSREIRFGLPHGGHGGGGPKAFLNPVIERPPFDNSFAFRVAGTGSCLNLRASPAAKAEIETCLPDGSIVSLSDPTPAPPYRKLAVWPADDILWVHIRSADGREGWVSSEYLRWSAP